MTHAARWLIRAVWADMDERGRVGVLRADPAAWEGGEILAGGRILGEVFQTPLLTYYWTSGTLRMSGSTFEGDSQAAMDGMIASFDVQGKLDLDAIDPLPDGMFGAEC